MEMSAEDMYQMYDRMSEQMRKRRYPATLDDLWSCLTGSAYLQAMGAKMLPDGKWSMPSSDSWPGIVGTRRQDESASDASFVSWSNSSINHVLSVIGKLSEDTPYIEKITIPEKGNVVGLAVATTDGIRLITSYGQLESIAIDADYVLTKKDIKDCRENLVQLVKEDFDSRLRMQKAETDNLEIARLHARFLSQVTIEILQQIEKAGCPMATDAIKQLEANMKGVYSVYLSPEEFHDKASELLFVITSNSGRVHVTVNGILLVCVLELIKRETNAIRGKNSEKRTSDVIHRLERR